MTTDTTSSFAQAPDLSFFHRGPARRAGVPSTAPASPAAQPSQITLSTEQEAVVDAVSSGRDVVVDATVGSGKTSTIQAMCTLLGSEQEILYLTYSKLLKLDAQRRVRGARVQNYHGVIYPSLKNAGIRCGISDSVRTFNERFLELSSDFPRYDLLVVDEYQDINEEYAQLLRNIKSVNPLMQVVMVGDLAQKVRADTTLDVQRFVKEFCEDPVMLPFTQSFRLGEEMADRLSRAWNKPIVGVNENQVVKVMPEGEVTEYMSQKAPGDLLCLGRRNGPMASALNVLEHKHSGVFNKNTVYASIRDGDSSVTYGDDAAVFTTFDSSKGLERPTSVLYDYDEGMWEMRLGMPSADPEVLRNVFLVAASRGKDEVVFARREGTGPARQSSSRVGQIPIARFTELEEGALPTYKAPRSPSDCFDFKYAENIEACFDLLAVERLDDGTSAVIEIDRNDGLIDLSPAVGHYQEATYFAGYSAEREMAARGNDMSVILFPDLGDGTWRNCLLLAAADTEQMRYADQVDSVIPKEATAQLRERLATLLPADCRIQVMAELTGQAKLSRSKGTPITFRGVMDAVHEETVYELKFVSELDHPMFLQLALYLVMSGYEEGVLWNTRTDERWSVRVPDRRRFMDAVVLCVSKQAYKAFAQDG